MVNLLRLNVVNMSGFCIRVLVLRINTDLQILNHFRNAQQHNVIILAYFTDTHI
jgi:hypothetical protein